MLYVFCLIAHFEFGKKLNAWCFESFGGNGFLRFHAFPVGYNLK